MGRNDHRAVRIPGPSVRRLTDVCLIENLPAEIGARIIELLGKGPVSGVDLSGSVLLGSLLLVKPTVDPLRADASCPVLRSQVSSGHHLFSNPCQIELYELLVPSKVDDSTVLGQLLIRVPRHARPIIINLSCNEYIATRALVMKNIALDNELHDKRDLCSVTCSSEEIEIAFQESDATYKRVDKSVKTPRCIERYFEYLNRQVAPYIGQLVRGTAARGFRLTVHPSRVCFVPARPVNGLGKPQESLTQSGEISQNSQLRWAQNEAQPATKRELRKSRNRGHREM